MEQPLEEVCQFDALSFWHILCIYEDRRSYPLYLDEDLWYLQKNQSDFGKYVYLLVFLTHYDVR